MVQVSGAHDVFLAYARVDGAIAAQVHDALMGRGLRVFWDQDIPPGVPFPKHIGDALDAARVVVVLVGETTAASHYVGAEIVRTIENQIPLVPVYLDHARLPKGARPHGLEALNHLDLAAQGLDAVSDRIAASLGHAGPPRLASANAPAVPAPVAAAPALTWLHVSDIHIGHGDATHRRNQQEILARLLDDVRRMRAEVGPPDLIMVTGDVAFSGKAEQYGDPRSPQGGTAAAWLRDLCAAAGAPRAALHVVPGNHDVDRARVSPLMVDLRRADHARIADTILEKPRDAALLTESLEAYATFAERLGSPLGVTDAPGPSSAWTSRPWSVVHRNTGLGRVRIVGLDTAIASRDDRDTEGDNKLLLSETQRVSALTSARDDELTLVLMHHPPELLRDGEELVARLQNLPHVLLSGHVHVARGSAVDTIGGAGLLRFSAGAAHGERGEVHHGYAWARLGTDGLSYYPRIWEPSRHEFVASSTKHKLDAAGATRRARSRLPETMEAFLQRLEANPPPPPPPVADRALGSVTPPPLASPVASPLVCVTIQEAGGASVLGVRTPTGACIAPVTWLDRTRPIENSVLTLDGAPVPLRNTCLPAFDLLVCGGADDEPVVMPSAAHEIAWRPAQPRPGNVMVEGVRASMALNLKHTDDGWVIEGQADLPLGALVTIGGEPLGLVTHAGLVTPFEVLTRYYLAAVRLGLPVAASVIALRDATHARVRKCLDGAEPSLLSALRARVGASAHDDLPATLMRLAIEPAVENIRDEAVPQHGAVLWRLVGALAPWCLHQGDATLREVPGSTPGAKDCADYTIIADEMAAIEAAVAARQGRPAAYERRGQQIYGATSSEGAPFDHGIDVGRTATVASFLLVARKSGTWRKVATWAKTKHAPGKAYAVVDAVADPSNQDELREQRALMEQLHANEFQVVERVEKFVDYHTDLGLKLLLLGLWDLVGGSPAHR